MKILHISTSDLAHGAGIAAYNLHLALRELGHDSKMLVSLKLSRDAHIYPIKPTPISGIFKIVEKLTILTDRIFNQFTVQNFLSSLPFDLSKHPLVKEAEIIHIHNLHWQDRHFSILTLKYFDKTKPLIWTFHDMWPLTGHCIQSLDCTRWQKGCGQCPYLEMPMTIKIDTTAILWKLKKSLYSRTNFAAVTPSQWLKNLASQSPLLQDHSIHYIANGLSLNDYQPIAKEQARQALNLDLQPQQKILLFAVAHWNATFKGYPDFEKAMLTIQSRYPNLFLLGFGNGDFSETLKQQFSNLAFGYVEHSKLKSIVYSAADLLIFPTKGDNLPSVVMESMACGTPVIAYNTGGIPDMITHLETGYIAKYGDVNDLINGVLTLLEDDNLRNKMSIRGLETIQQNFTSKIQAENYLELYQNKFVRENENNLLL